MKIIFIGGGTGGHFYPLIAVAEEIDKYAQENQLVQPKKYYLGPSPYDEKALYDVGMKYIYCPAGKMRRTKDIKSRIKNIFSIIPITLGTVKAILNLLLIFPDAVFSKGGYTSFPVLLAARTLRIPVVIHESDSALGRVGKWSAAFAKWIGVAYPEAEKELTESQQKRAARIGVPIRNQLKHNPEPKAHELLKINPEIPTVAVLGGSSGAKFLNDNLIDALPVLLKKYQVVHQTGKTHIENVKQETESFLRGMKDQNAYHPFAYFNTYYLRVLYSAADVIITRAGSGTLFEIAEWGIPAIVVPIPEEVAHDQRKNAYAYARSAGGIVIEEQNLSPHLLSAKIEEVLSNKSKKEELGGKAKTFATPDAAKKVARLLVDILKSHEA